MERSVIPASMHELTCSGLRKGSATQAMREPFEIPLIPGNRMDIIVSHDRTSSREVIFAPADS